MASRRWTLEKSFRKGGRVLKGDGGGMGELAGEVPSKKAPYHVLVKQMFEERGELAGRLMVKQLEEAGVGRDVRVYNALISRVARMDDGVREAVKLFAEMRSAGISPDIITYRALIQAYKRAGDVEEAEEAIKEMISEGIEPDARIFNSLIVHLIRHNAEEDALRIVRWMKTLGVKQDTYLFTTLLSATSVRNDLQRAKEIRAEMDRCGVRPDIYTLTSFMRVLLSHRDDDGFRAVLKEIHRRKLKPTEHTMKMIIKGLSSTGRPEAAKELYKKMLSDSEDVPVKKQNTLLSVVAQGGESTEMESLLDQMEDPNTETLNVALKSYARNGDSVTAMKRFREFILPGRIVPNNLTISLLLKLSGSLNEIDIIQREIVRHKIELTKVSLAAMMSAYVRCGEYQGAISLFRNHLNQTKLLDAFVYTIAMDAYRRNNEMQKAIQVYDLMRREGHPPSSVSLTVLLHVYIGQDNIPAALETVQAMHDESEEVTAKPYNAIMRKLVATNRIQEAMDIFKLMEMRKVNIDVTTKAIHDNVFLRHRR